MGGVVAFWVDGFKEGDAVGSLVEKRLGIMVGAAGACSIGGGDGTQLVELELELVRGQEPDPLS